MFKYLLTFQKLYVTYSHQLHFDVIFQMCHFPDDVNFVNLIFSLKILAYDLIFSGN